MPRPPQQVPPDTLGGRIRAARKKLHYSLAQVAGQRYSTSLLSQIERNKIEPSAESLRYLAEQLHVPFDELETLAKRQKETEPTETRYRYFEAVRVKAAQAYAGQFYHAALDMLREINLPLVPSQLRWRLALLRGQCYFALREFLAAEKDFLYGVAELPGMVPEEQRQEVMLLRLNLAATLRELKQPEEALRQFEIALALMNGSTPVHHVADTHWGMSLIYAEQAGSTRCENEKRDLLNKALRHAEDARVLCRSIGQILRADLLTCQMALIEQALGRPDEARRHLQELLQAELPELERLAQQPDVAKKMLQEYGNVCSAAACALAGIELEAGHYDAALDYAQQAEDAGKLSYILRRADAYMMQGRIFDAMNPGDPRAEEAFRRAIAELEPTHRISARVRAHDLLGRFLLKNGKIDEGNAELDRVRQLTDSASIANMVMPAEQEQNDSGVSAEG